MVYTDDMKRKLDDILKAFKSYIDCQNYFDIVYSSKIGYVKILVQNPEDEGAERLDTPEKMLDVLFNEVINDVIFSPENQHHDLNSLTLSEYEKDESRRQLTKILKTIKDDGESYLSFLDQYLKSYQEQYQEGGQIE